MAAKAILVHTRPCLSPVLRCEVQIVSEREVQDRERRRRELEAAMNAKPSFRIRTSEVEERARALSYPSVDRYSSSTFTMLAVEFWL